MALSTRTRPNFPHSKCLPSGSFHKPLYPHLSEGRPNESHNHRKLTKLITWITTLSNSMKPRAMLCRATKDGQVMVERSDKTWSTGEEIGRPFQHFCLENPMNSMKRQKDMILVRERLILRNPICCFLFLKGLLFLISSWKTGMSRAAHSSQERS